MFKHLSTAAALLCLLQLPAIAQRAEHVIVIGVDGMTTASLRTPGATNLARLCARGAVNRQARAVMPTVSGPNWASIIMGAGPEQHGVTSNAWRPASATIRPTADWGGGLFPTIFSLIRRERPKAGIACFHHWGGFARYFDNQAADVVRHAESAAEVMRMATEYFAERRPLFTFVHLDNVDHAGHHGGYASAEHAAAVVEADRLIGTMLETLERAKVHERTVVMVVADHGGKEKKHGGESMEEIEVPWIIAGPGVRRGVELRKPMNVYDTAPTVAYILGISPPECWIGRPVLEAFSR